MLSRIPEWERYLSEYTGNLDKTLALHGRTGRSLGNDDFTTQLEIIAGRSLRAGKPQTKEAALLMRITSQDNTRNCSDKCHG
ncbi:MAG: hypothetical protein ACI8P9_005759 [Parasphingorhabdus sp.]|jgi:hypothetical protein